MLGCLGTLVSLGPLFMDLVLRGVGALLMLAEEVGVVEVEFSNDQGEHVKAWSCVTAFDLADVARRKTALSCERAERDAAFGAALTDDRADARGGLADDRPGAIGHALPAMTSGAP